MDNEMLSILVPIPIIFFLVVCIVFVIKGKRTKTSEPDTLDNADNPTKYSCDRSSLEPGDKFYVYGFGPHESVNNN